MRWLWRGLISSAFLILILEAFDAALWPVLLAYFVGAFHMRIVCLMEDT